MLYRTNLVALVSGGRKPKFAENTVMIYDDNSGKMVSGGWWREGHVTAVLTSDWLRVEGSLIYQAIFGVCLDRSINVKERPSPKNEYCENFAKFRLQLYWLCQVLEFTCPDPVLAVRMKRDKLVAVCR